MSLKDPHSGTQFQRDAPRCYTIAENADPKWSDIAKPSCSAAYKPA